MAVCNIENVRKRIEELEEKRKQLEEKLKQKESGLDRTRTKKSAARLGGQVARLKERLKAVEKLQKKLHKQEEKWKKTRADALKDLGQRGLSRAALSTLSRDERAAHLRGLVEHNAAEHVVVSQAYRIATLFPEEHQLLADTFGERIVDEKEDGTIVVKWRFRPELTFTGPQMATGTHRRGVTETIRSFFRSTVLHGFEYEKDYSTLLGGGDITRTLVDRHTGERYDVSSDMDALVTADELAWQKLNAEDLVPPFTGDRVPGPGPGMPNTVPLGRIGADGKRLTTNAGEPRQVEPIHIHHSSLLGYLLRNVYLTRSAWGRIARLFEKAVGSEKVPRFYRAVDMAMALREKALSHVDRFKLMLSRAMAQHGIDPSDVSQKVRIHKAMILVDNMMETLRVETYRRARKAGASHDEAVEQALSACERTYDSAIQAARNEFGLSDGETNMIRWVHHSFFDALFPVLGLDPREYRYGYFPRVRRTLSSYYEIRHGVESENPTDWLAIDPTLDPWHGSHGRWGKEADDVRELDPVLHRQMEELAASEVLELATLGDPFDILLSYARQGITRRYAGEALRDFIAEFSAEDVNGAVRVLLGDARASADIVARAKRDVLAIMGLPTPAMAEKNARVRAGMLSRAREAMKLARKLESINAPRFVVEGVRWYFRRLGIKASRTEVRSFLDSFAYSHRAMTFGLALMAPVRDTATTMLIGNISFDSPVMAKAFKETYLLLAAGRGRDYLRLYMDQFRRGWVRWFTEDMPLQELVGESSIFFGMSPEEVRNNPREALRRLTKADFRELSTRFYKLSDLGTRVAINHAAEIQARRAFQSFSRHGDVARLVEEAHLASLPSERAKQLIEIAKRGEEEAFVNRYVLDKQAETAMNYARYSSAPFMDYALGRVFFQYGTWSYNFLNTMWSHLASPWQLAKDGIITPGQAAKMQAKLYAKLAVSAEATYALGAVMGIDTTDWIPWIHNAVPTGGPMLSNALALRDALTTDPDSAVGRWDEEPFKKAMLTISKVVPGFPIWPGTPNTVRRLIGQTLADVFPADEEFVRRLFGLSREAYHDSWNSFLEVGGFHPLTPKADPPFRGGGLLYAMNGAVFGRMQDFFARHTGLPRSPASIRGLR